MKKVEWLLVHLTPRAAKALSAGINRGVVDLPDGTHIEVLGGKDNATVKLKGDIEAGTFEYSATDSTGLDHVRARAALEEAIADDVKDTFPEIIDTIIDALLGLP